MKPEEVQYFAFEAIDAWFFREPRPFHADESAAGGMASLFPPPARTLAGALRAALARSRGWDGRGRWPDGLNDDLGDGDDLGRLSFVGPLVCKGGRTLYPLPSHLLGAGEHPGWKPVALLSPGPPVDCDLGRDVRLPEPATPTADLTGAGPPEKMWGTRSAIEAILAGRLPDATGIVDSAEIYSVEARVGIGRDNLTRKAKDHALYAARFVRPQKKVAILFGVAGLGANFGADFSSILPLGGEGRAAAVTRASHEVRFPAAPASLVAGARRYSVTFLTPAFLPAEAWLPGAALPGFPGKLVSACCAEPLRLGGWDGIHRRSSPARSAVAAGSTFFIELAGERVDDVLALHGKHFDPRGDGRWGYGRIAIGAWAADALQGDRS